MKLAIIDLGSNSARMTVWNIEDKTEVLSMHREYVRLSEGLAGTEMLQEEPMRRTIEALIKLKNIATEKNCEEIICVATEAVRRAKNADEFIKMVMDKCNLSVRVLNGRDEAYYDYLGSEELLSGGGLLCDVGGGSVEIADVTRDKEKRFFCTKTGAVVMYEKFYENHSAMLDYLLGQYSRLCLSAHDKIVALGGTARAIGAYFYENPSQIHAKEITKDELISLFNKLREMSADERKEIAALGRERGDISVAGISTFIALFEITGAKTMVLSANGLREGMLKELIDKHKSV